MDDDALSLLVLMGNAERLVVARGIDRAHRPLIEARIDRYLAEIGNEMERLRRRRLGAIGELQFAAEAKLPRSHRAVRAARARLHFAERMLLRLATYRRELNQCRAELHADERHRL